MAWNHRTNEDRWLREYHVRVGGRIYAEVPLGGPSEGNGLPAWARSTVRRLDAVRFPAPGDTPEIVRFSDDPEGFRGRVGKEQAWLIEIKRKLNRTMIGQIVAGADMFQAVFGVAPARCIALCTASDDALAWVCERRFIAVELHLEER